MYTILAVLSPQYPAIHTHYGIVGIDEHIAKEPTYPQQVDKEHRTDDARGIHPYIPFLGKEHTQKAEEYP